MDEYNAVAVLVAAAAMATAAVLVVVFTTTSGGGSPDDEVDSGGGGIFGGLTGADADDMELGGVTDIVDSSQSPTEMPWMLLSS